MLLIVLPHDDPDVGIFSAGPDKVLNTGCSLLDSEDADGKNTKSSYDLIALVGILGENSRVVVTRLLVVGM